MFNFRRGFMTVSLQTPIFIWPGRRGVLQPFRLAAVGWKGMSPPGSDLQFALAGVFLGCHRLGRSRDAQRLPPGSDLQFALAGVESGSHRECRSREVLRVVDDDNDDQNSDIQYDNDAHNDIDDDGIDGDHDDDDGGHD